MKANYTARGEQINLRWQDGLLVMDGQGAPSQYVAPANAEQQAIALFKSLLTQFNRQDRPISPSRTANNGAPAVFADLEAAKVLHKSKRQRRRLLRDAMETLFKAELITTMPGPKSVSPSKRNPCLYMTPADDEKTLFDDR